MMNETDFLRFVFQISTKKVIKNYFPALNFDTGYFMCENKVDSLDRQISRGLGEGTKFGPGSVEVNKEHSKIWE